MNVWIASHLPNLHIYWCNLPDYNKFSKYELNLINIDGEPKDINPNTSEAAYGAVVTMKASVFKRIYNDLASISEFGKWFNYFYITEVV